MREYFRPYTLIATLADTDASSITLKDSAGAALECNYIAVEASGAEPNAYYTVESNVGQTNYSAPGSHIGQVSGLVGGIASTQRGVVEYLLSDADRTSGIKIQLSEAGATYFFITYGQVSLVQEAD